MFALHLGAEDSGRVTSQGGRDAHSEAVELFKVAQRVREACRQWKTPGLSQSPTPRAGSIQVYSMVPRHHTEDASGTRNDFELLSTCDHATVVPFAARALRFAAASSQSLSQAPPPRFWRSKALPRLRHDASVRAAPRCARPSQSLKQPTAPSCARMSCVIAVYELLFPLVCPRRARAVSFASPVPDLSHNPRDSNPRTDTAWHKTRPVRFDCCCSSYSRFG